MSATPYEDFVARLSGVRRSSPAQGCARAVRALCPACSDQHKRPDPTLSVSETSGDGRVLLHCYRQCGADAIAAALGMTVADLYPDHMRLGGKQRAGGNGGPARWAGLMHSIDEAEERGALLAAACAHDAEGELKVRALLDFMSSVRRVREAGRALLRERQQVATRGQQS